MIFDGFKSHSYNAFPAVKFIHRRCIVKNKMFLTGITGVLLVFGMMVMGCDNGTTSDSNNGGNENPVLGMWYHGGTANNPTELLIFSGTSGGKQYFYGLWSPNVESTTDTSNKLLHIGGSQYVYTVSGNTLTVKDYIDSRGDTADVPFTRIEGSTKTDEHDVWYTASRTNADQNRTLLVIKSNNVTFTAVGAGGVDYENSVWDRWEYAPDNSNSRIDWKDDNSTTSYSLDGSTLTIANWSGDYTKTNL
jgi:hypothetical protein